MGCRYQIAKPRGTSSQNRPSWRYQTVPNNRRRYQTIQKNERFAWDFLRKMIWYLVPNKWMSVPNRQTAWDFLAKQAVLAVPNWYQTIDVGTKQYEKQQFRVGLPPKIVWYLVPNESGAVPNRQTAWDFLEKQALLAVPNGTKQ